MHRIRRDNVPNGRLHQSLFKVAKSWELFISDKPIERTDVRPLVLDSWQRCRRQGVDPFRLNVTKAATDGCIDQLQVRNKRLLDALWTRVSQIATELDRRRCAVAAADAQGTLLTIHGNRDYVNDLCQNWSAPGFQWDEQRNGTNAIGTALVLGRGVQVNAHEHFCQPDKRLTCMADLVRDPFDHSVLGVIDITTDDPESEPDMLALLHRMIGEVGSDVVASVAAELARIRDAYAQAQRYGEGLIAFDRYGRMVAGQGTNQGTNQGADQDTGPLGLPLKAGQQIEGFDADLVRERSVATLPGWLRSADIRWFADGSGGLLHFSRPSAVGALRRQVALLPPLAAVAASSPSLTPLLQRAQLYSRRRMPILLLGETGNGKDVMARAIHAATARPGAPFIAVNCAALPRELAASELFGHVDGAFTGARKGGCAGRFEDAHGGTIFLDEIGDMPIELQPYLLRVLEERIVSRLGEAKERPVDVHVIAATNRALDHEIEAGRFRRDLYFRLNCGAIEVPSLRHRMADLEPLIDTLLFRILMPGEGWPRLGDGLLETLRHHDWPGNVRELRNVLECLVAMSPDGVLEIADLPDAFARQVPATPETGAPEGTLDRIERDTIVMALDRHNGDVSAASCELGISRSTIYRRINRYGIGNNSPPRSRTMQ